MIREMVCCGAALFWSAGVACAQLYPFSGIDRPLYPEVIVPTDDLYSADPELSALRAAIDKAGDARTRQPDGSEVYDPEAMLPLLADRIELFVGQGRRSIWEEFVSIGTQPASEALGIVGRLSRGSDSAEAIVQQRYGMHVLASLAMEPTVGSTPWLGGRICTASYGRIDWPVWASLWEKIRFYEREEWRIAVIARPSDGEIAPPDWPKKFQMVPVSRSQKRSGGSIGIVEPQGETVFFEAWFRPQEGHFAPYLNSHVCFEKQEGDWKISAVAIRLD